MSWINLGEVAYVVERLSGVDRSREVVRELQRLLTLDAPSPRRVLEAARLKANHTMAYADAFALATAIAHDAIVLTGDPELLDSGEDWPVEDLRPR
jgi:ribonuclease VapC